MVPTQISQDELALQIIDHPRNVLSRCSQLPYRIGLATIGRELEELECKKAEEAARWVLSS